MDKIKCKKKAKELTHCSSAICIADLVVWMFPTKVFAYNIFIGTYRKNLNKI